MHRGTTGGHGRGRGVCVEGLLVACVALAGCVLARPARASSPSATDPITVLPNQPVTTGLAPAVDGARAYSVNWSGYAATSSAPFSEVTSTYVQPKVTCFDGAETVFWVGFDGLQSTTVEQSGTGAVCGTGAKPKPSYFAWWEMYPTNSIQVMPITVGPGDKITATDVYEPNSGRFLLGVDDLSDGEQYTEKTTCGSGQTCQRASAEWIVERPGMADGTYTPLADWGTMALGGDLAAGGSGAAQPISSFSHVRLTMTGDPDYDVVLAQASPLSASGKRFSDTWTGAQ